MLIDADILIWALRKSQDAEAAIAAIPAKDRSISVVTRLELIEGIRNKTELKYLANWLEKSCLNVWPLNTQIGELASNLMVRFSLSAGLQVDDALLAATAVFYDETLFTANYKHFKDLGIPLLRFVKS